MNFASSLPQIFRKRGKLDVIVLNVIEPSHFILREAPIISSQDVFQFMELEKDIENYYSFIETKSMYLPEKDEVVIAYVVLEEGLEPKYCRGQVKYILDTTKGQMYNVYLLDYGKTFNIMRNKVFKIKRDFLTVPFQAVHFHLLGIKPQTLSPNALFSSLSYSPCEKWDVSAEEYVQEVWKELNSAQIEIFALDDSSHVYGFMHILVDSEYKCLNDLLIQQSYAWHDKKSLSNLTFLGEAKENTMLKEETFSGYHSAASHLLSPNKSRKLEEVRTLRKEMFKEVIEEKNVSIPLESKTGFMHQNQPIYLNGQANETTSPRGFKSVLSSLKDHESLSGSIYSPPLSPITSTGAAAWQVGRGRGTVSIVQPQNSTSAAQSAYPNPEISRVRRKIFPDQSTSASVQENNIGSSSGSICSPPLSPTTSTGVPPRQVGRGRGTLCIVQPQNSSTSVAQSVHRNSDISRVNHKNLPDQSTFTAAHQGNNIESLSDSNCSSPSNPTISNGASPSQIGRGRGTVSIVQPQNGTISATQSVHLNSEISRVHHQNFPDQSTSTAAHQGNNIEILSASFCSPPSNPMKSTGTSPRQVGRGRGAVSIVQPQNGTTSAAQSVHSNHEVSRVHHQVFPDQSTSTAEHPGNNNKSSSGSICSPPSSPMKSIGTLPQQVGRGRGAVSIVQPQNGTTSAAQSHLNPEISRAHCQISHDQSTPASDQDDNIKNPETKKVLSKLATEKYAELYRKAQSRGVVSTAQKPLLEEHNVYVNHSHIDSKSERLDSVLLENVKLGESATIKSSERDSLGSSLSKSSTPIAPVNGAVSTNSVSATINPALKSAAGPKSSGKSHQTDKAAIISCYQMLIQKRKSVSPAATDTSANFKTEKPVLKSCDSVPIQTIGRGRPVCTSLHKDTSYPAPKASEKSLPGFISASKAEIVSMNLQPGKLDSPETSTSKKKLNASDESDHTVSTKPKTVKGEDSALVTSELSRLIESLPVQPEDIDLPINLSFSEEERSLRSEAESEDSNILSEFISTKFARRGLNADQPACDNSFFKTNLDFSDRSLFDKQRIPALQIGGTAIPILRTEDAPFVPWLHQRLKELKFWGPSCIQSVVWPCVTRGHSFIAIAPPHSGKTIAYLLPIISNLLHRVEYSDFSHGHGPFCLVLCSSWKKAHAVDQQLQLFLENCGKICVQTAFSNVSDPRKKISLLNGCDILVATPSCLVEFLKDGATNFARCCHFILDDGNDIVKYHKDQIKSIMQYLLSSLKSQKEANPVQFGICAERWSRNVSMFVKKFMPYHQLFFTSFLESAIYARIPIHVHVCPEENKISSLLKILETTSHSKIVILTIDATSAKELHDILIKSAVYALIADESMAFYNHNAIKLQWSQPHSSDDNTILILTDYTLLSINISDADCLIHYDLPEESRLQFSYRFGCLAEHMLQAQETKPLNCVSHVLVTETCTTQALSLISVLQRQGSNIPPELKTMAINQKKKNIKLEGPLCKFFKAFGVCTQSSCPNRHVICKELDKPNVVPKQGDVRIFVNHIFDATHFNAQILQYLDPESGATVSRSEEYAKLSIALQDYYKEPQNCVKLHSREPGAVCAVKEKNGIFHRAKILEAANSDEIEAPLLFIDEGWVKTAKINTLFSIPDEFLRIPSMAAEVYLCGLISSDPSLEWNPDSSQFVYNLIQGQEVHGKIVLCLGDTLFLDPVVIREQALTFVKEPVNLINLGKLLKDKGYAMDNKQHISRLHAACEGLLDLPKVTKRFHFEEDNKKPQPNWAFLELGVEDDVFVSHIESPHQLYLQRAKFEQSFDKMQAEIQQRVEENALSRCTVLQKGMYCLAPLPEENSYFRSQVMDIVEEDGELAAQVFYVDFGDQYVIKQNTLYQLPHDLMLFPFQAIECELAGISSPHGGWTMRATDALYDMTRDDENCTKLLRARAWKKTPRYAGGSHFAVGLRFMDINLSQYLIEEGLAAPAEILCAPELPNVSPIPQTQSDEDPDSSNSGLTEDEDAAALMAGSLCLMAARLEEKAKGENVETVQTDKPIENADLVTSGSSKDRILPINPRAMTTNNQSPNGKARLTWWNTAEKVMITLHISDVSIYEYDVSYQGFKFNCDVNGKHYSYDETLYAEVLPDSCETKGFGNRIEFILTKEKAVEWPRLLRQTEKVPYIKYDLLHLQTDSDSENKLLDLLETKAGMEESSESYSSASEDELAPSWKEMCEDVNPFKSLT